MNQYDHNGRVALITGGARGIGDATAERLLASGARVASFDLEASPRAEVLSLTGSVTSSAELAAAVERVGDELGGPDILVCCAGVAGETLPLAEVSDDEWNQVVAVNLTGTFLANRAVLPGMVSRGYGRIVNVSSLAGKDGSARSAAYSSSKAAVIALTKAVGKESAGTGVIANSITPAVIATPILDGVSPDAVAAMTNRIPLGRPGQPSEVAAMIAFLVSEEVSFSTGACFDLSGGVAQY